MEATKGGTGDVAGDRPSGKYFTSPSLHPEDTSLVYLNSAARTSVPGNKYRVRMHSITLEVKATQPPKTMDLG